MSTSSEALWGGTDGRSIGVATNVDYASALKYVWVGMTSAPGTSSASYCGASGTDVCLGAAYYDLSTSTLGRYWFSTPISAGAAADVAGSGTSALTTKYLVADKVSSTEGWKKDGPGYAWYSDVSGSEPSQVSAVDASLAVATDAGFSVGCSTITSNSRVRLLEWPMGTMVERDAAIDTGDVFKPEGVYVRANTDTNCDYDAIAYVTDYCGDMSDSVQDGEVFVYGIDTTNKTLTQVGNPLKLPDGCNPSTITYHGPTDQLFVLCQTADTIIALTLSNACTINQQGTPVVLRYVPSSNQEPSCTSTPSLNSCNDLSGANCTPHDFAWTDAGPFSTDWLFVTLDGVSQIITLKASDPSKQYGFLGRDGSVSSFRPTEFEVAGQP